jgi:hypothetical protein
MRLANPPHRRASLAAYLVLLTRCGVERALLFNAEKQFLAEILDDPYAVLQLQSSGRPCGIVPASILLSMAEESGPAAVRCFDLKLNPDYQQSSAAQRAAARPDDRPSSEGRSSG